MNIITERKKGRPGAKHFRTEVKHVRQKEYTMIVAIGEFLDFPILNAKNIDIIITFKPGTDNKKILQIQIRDDTITGFQNLSENNDKNPFNFGYNSSSHDNDESISEFGAGLKEAFIALSDKITIYTKSDDQYYKILFNIEKMSKIEDVNESFNYDEKTITQQEYIEEHNLQCGSSIILEEMVDGIIIDLDELKKSIINTYGKIIKERNIVVKLNGEQLSDSNISPFDNVYCKPFNSITKLYAKKNDTSNEEYYMEVKTDKTRYYLYIDETKPWSPEITTRGVINKLETYKNLNPECLIMTLKGTERQFCQEIDKNPVNGGDIKFYKRGRQHGSYSAPTTNGACNHVFLELEIYSKKIGKELGMTVNKLIKLNKENKLCNVIKGAIHSLQSKHAYDSGSKTTSASTKYNIIKATGLPISHVNIPTKLKEKLVAAAKKAEEEARLAAEEKERLAAVEKARLAEVEKARLAAEEKARLAAEKARLAAEEEARLAAEKIQRTHRAKAGKVERLASEKARLAAEKLKAAKAEAEEKARLEKARLEKARLEKARLEAAIKIQRIHRSINQKRQLIKKPEPKPKPKPEPILVDRFRRGSVEGKKFKEVINYYINQVGDNEDVCGEDLAMYNKVCKKLNIIP